MYFNKLQVPVRVACIILLKYKLLYMEKQHHQTMKPENSDTEDDSSNSVYDSGDDGSVDVASQSSEEDFEDQGSSDDSVDGDDDDDIENRDEEDEEDEKLELKYEMQNLETKAAGKKRSTGTNNTGTNETGANDKGANPALWMHSDDLSSDDEDDAGANNRIGRVPLHWYEDYDHIGYNSHGTKIGKSASISGDQVDKVIGQDDNLQKGKFVVRDALNDKDVELSARQIELIRRVQAGAYAHSEHDGNAEYIDYFSGVDREISGLSNQIYEPKHRFQPSRWEKLQVDRLLEKLEKGDISMDYLTGKINDMNDDRKKQESDKPFALWTGEEEDLLNMRKGPQHISAPKLPPPGHAASYRPPDEFLPTDEDLQKWEEMPLHDRPNGHLIPKKFDNLRSVGAYAHSVREAFERCLDLYLAPRVFKRRLNIDPESLVPRLPKSNDLKPFPTTRCIEYDTPYSGNDPPIVRSITCSPNGQFIASGSSDGFVRMWEVQTGRLLHSWDLFSLLKTTRPNDFEEEGPTIPVVCVEWNPNRSHHCLLAAIGKFVVVIATGTAGKNDVELNDALLHVAAKGLQVSKVASAEWLSVRQKLPPGSSDVAIGPICLVITTKDVLSVQWQIKGDYFVSISPKAASAAVLIHQLSKGHSQQPFKKAKGESQCACFHPTKPFLFLANQQHVRIYHLVKQTLMKRLFSGCRWISSISVHPSGDHLIVSSLDRRLVWFDLDLSSSPYKTLKYHTRGIRSCQFHRRYPLMASSSDDGTTHIFHSMVYSDLMRNPLIVPVKILRGHSTTNNLGVLTHEFHPTQPWIFTGGADGKIILFQDI